MNIIKPQLDQPITRMRSMTTKGIAAGKSAIERTGGKFGAGLIKGFAVVTRGEALGHGVWLDTTFVRQTRMSLNALKRGAKSRFTHPGLSADGMGKLLGRAMRAKQEEDLVRSDLHFAKSAHRAPEGNLAEYVMSLADEDPEAFGSSIVFTPDYEAERDFVIAHGGRIVQDPYYGEIYDLSEYKSPDPLNEKNLPHARLKELHAVDIVDEPAANPSGMFGRDPVFAEAEQLMLHVAGIESHLPKLQSLGVDPRRVTYFFTNFLDRHGLQLTAKPKEQTMPPIDPTKPTEQLQNVVVDPTTATKSTEKTYSAADLKRFSDAFGAKGTDWLLAGKSFDECKQLHADEQIAALKAEKEALAKEKDEALSKVTKERDELQAKVASLGTIAGEKDPVSFSTAEGNKKEEPKKFSNLPDGLARFAAGIKRKGTSDASRN